MSRPKAKAGAELARLRWDKPREQTGAPTTLGGRLRAQRLACGLTLEQLAKEVGSDKPALSRYEADQVFPRGARLAALAAALGTTVEQLREG